MKEKIRSIPPLDVIHARCIDDGGCLIWQGSTNGTGHCKVANLSGRRVVWTHVNGRPRRNQLVAMTCGQAKRLNPDHMALTSKAAVSRAVGAQPATKAKRTASLEKHMRANGRITMEIARAIRSDPRMGIEIAAELGVSTSLVSRVRCHSSWRERSVFSGLGARS